MHRPYQQPGRPAHLNARKADQKPSRGGELRAHPAVPSSSTFSSGCPVLDGCASTFAGFPRCIATHHCRAAYVVPRDMAIANSSTLLWPRSDICMMIWMHLDDEATLCTAVVRLLVNIRVARPAHDVIYGVISSDFHCVIVRIGRSSGGTFIHTLPWPFLPTWYATSSSTPGMTALGCLFCLPDCRITSSLMKRPLRAMRTKTKNLRETRMKPRRGSPVTQAAFTRLLVYRCCCQYGAPRCHQQQQGRAVPPRRHVPRGWHAAPLGAFQHTIGVAPLC